MKRVCGLDVHKDTIFCVTYDGKEYSPVKEYTTLTSAIQEMGGVLNSQGVTRIAMESTGMYWIPVWNILEDMGFDLMLVNPYLIKQMPGRKSDVKDAQWIATLLHKRMLRGSLVPDARIRELRTYSRKYMKLQQQITSVLQELERTLEICSIRVTSFVSNISGKSVLRVIESIVGGETSPEALVESIHGRIINAHTKQTILESLKGYVTEHHRFMLEISLQQYHLLNDQSERCLKKMGMICHEHYPEELELLMTIPGVSNISAMIIIAETGADMKAFETSSKFSGWTGLRPRNDESAGKFKSTATTKGNRYLRAILVQVAWAASRTKGSYFKEKFNRLAIRKPRKKALVAIARKIAVTIWNILTEKQGFDPVKLPIYDPVKLQNKLAYHQRESNRILDLMKC
jgi:transposase